MCTRTMPALLLLVLTGSFAAQEDPILRGDTAWERRNEGAQGRRAAPGPIVEAVAAYEQALAEDSKDLEAYWKLLRALHFQGDYTTDDRKEEQKIFGRGREVSEQALDLLAERVGGRQVLDDMKPQDFPDVFGGEPAVARIYFWSAVNWGLWGRAFSKVAAARQGVGSRIRDYAQVVIALDPEYEAGGGYRIHGRLHTEAPKIPFVTGWIDRQEGIDDIRRAHRIAPRDAYNRLYLADGLLRFEKKERALALRMLRELAASVPRPANAVAEASAFEEARRILSDAD